MKCVVCGAPFPIHKMAPAKPTPGCPGCRLHKDYDDKCTSERRQMSQNAALYERVGELRKKLGIARGMLISARGVIAGTLPPEDCTPEDVTKALDESADPNPNG